MSLATPVLERKIGGEEAAEYREAVSECSMTEEERHNSRISVNYAKLINPETTIKDLIAKEPVRQQQKDILLAPVREETAKPYLVENARADAEIFRADSLFNKNRVMPVNVAATCAAEEENEDLRPTQTTIQYRTVDVKKNTEEGKIVNNAATRKASMSKRDKIIIVAVVAVIVALFVLIIVNSAIISGINNNISELQTVLPDAAEKYSQALAEKDAYLNEENLYQVVSDFATANGMVLK